MEKFYKEDIEKLDRLRIKKSKCIDCVWFNTDEECTHPDDICEYKKAGLPEGYSKLL